MKATALQNKLKSYQSSYMLQVKFLITPLQLATHVDRNLAT